MLVAVVVEARDAAPKSGFDCVPKPWPPKREVDPAAVEDAPKPVVVKGVWLRWVDEWMDG